MQWLTYYNYATGATATANVYSFPDDDVKADSEYDEKREQYLQLIAGQAKVATPDDYEDEDLYAQMTQKYYVCKLFY